MPNYVPHNTFERHRRKREITGKIMDSNEITNKLLSMFQVGEQPIPSWLAIDQPGHGNQRHYIRLPNRDDLIVCQSVEGKKVFEFRRESISQLVEIYRNNEDAYEMAQNELIKGHVGTRGELHRKLNPIIAICHQLEGKDYQ